MRSEWNQITINILNKYIQGLCKFSLNVNESEHILQIPCRQDYILAATLANDNVIQLIEAAYAPSKAINREHQCMLEHFAEILRSGAIYLLNKVRNDENLPFRQSNTKIAGNSWEAELGGKQIATTTNVSMWPTIHQICSVTSFQSSSFNGILKNDAPLMTWRFVHGALCWRYETELILNPELFS